MVYWVWTSKEVSLMSNTPTKRFRIGAVTAAVFENEGNGNGKFYTVNVTRSYKDGSDWKNTSSLNAGDLLNASKALERAETWISQQ